MLITPDSYKKLQEKYGLPQLDTLQSAFQFQVDGETDIHDIRNEVSGKLFDFTERVIEPLLLSMHYCHSIERDMLTEDETHEVFKIYRQIQSLRWRNNMILISSGEEETARWIGELWGFWSVFEPIATRLCLKFSKGWDNLRFKDVAPEYGYHG